jgi:hypothetical protein
VNKTQYWRSELCFSWLRFRVLRGPPLGRPRAKGVDQAVTRSSGRPFRVLNGLDPPGSIRRSSVLAGRSWDSMTKADTHGRSPVDGVQR